MGLFGENRFSFYDLEIKFCYKVQTVPKKITANVD